VVKSHPIIPNKPVEDTGREAQNIRDKKLVAKSRTQQISNCNQSQSPGETVDLTQPLGQVQETRVNEQKMPLKALSTPHWFSSLYP